ncbi:phage minor capsid protein [Coprococcus comes]|uniref:phage minor capsid protein n=1 Tax=Coprococcus comes TaxID=410072 RepID=UPI001FADCFCD|nr:phage minor capsid protein [Coprococcus comes]MDC0798858.1 phage minor capsid protein [Coprococcus comes]
MRDDYKEKIASKIAARYISLEERILQDIARRIKRTGEITSTADWQINRLRILGYSSEDIEREIKKTLDVSYPEMFELYDKVIDWEYVRNKDVYEQINIEFIPYEENRQLQQITDALIQQSLEDLENVTKSLGFYLDYNGRKVLTPLSQVYTNYLDNACFDIVTGAFDYGSVLRRVVTQLTNSGLRKIEYGSGYASRVEVAARRAVMTGVANLTGEIADYNAKKLGAEHFEVEWHAGARPTHAVWQGRVWTKEQLYSVCGLGTVTGLLGANCYHTYYPFFPGISQRNWSDEWLEAQNRKESKPKEFRGKEYTLYEAKQRQRQMETAMRAQREKVQMLQDGGADRQEVMLQKAKYQGQLNEYAAFSRKMGLKEERERIYIDGRGRIAPSQYDPKMRISIPDTVSKEARLSKEIEAKINAAIKKLDSEYIIYLDLIESEALEKGDIFVTGAYLDDEGILRHSMVINRRRNFENIEMQMRSRYNKGVMAGRNFEDYIAHEMAHIMPFQNCITAEEYMELNAKIKSQFIKGISKYADKKRDGRESLAEAFVRYRNGEVIPNEARKLIEKYILPWRRI